MLLIQRFTVSGRDVLDQVRRRVIPMVFAATAQDCADRLNRMTPAQVNQTISDFYTTWPIKEEKSEKPVDTTAPPAP
jgi:UV DNA damage repair endonuclease